MMLLHMLASFAIALLSGMGVGSAGLFVLYLTSVAGLPQLQSQGLNLVFFLLSAGASFLYHVRRRHIPWGLVLFLILCHTGLPDRSGAYASAGRQYRSPPVRRNAGACRRFRAPS